MDPKALQVKRIFYQPKKSRIIFPYFFISPYKDSLTFLPDYECSNQRRKIDFSTSTSRDIDRSKIPILTILEAAKVALSVENSQALGYTSDSYIYVHPSMFIPGSTKLELKISVCYSY
ncbi:hypothetical protein K7432_018533 [Basidiobolus ranarum]|uniref:Uncharacterized protein n=1 Tax=Basidiobolus ranarum TaxID=34480 RepID=A0ABR2VJB0_9FUNG